MLSVDFTGGNSHMGVTLTLALVLVAIGTTGHVVLMLQTCNFIITGQFMQVQILLSPVIFILC